MDILKPKRRIGYRLVELDDIPTILEMVVYGIGLAILPQARAYVSTFNKVQIISLKTQVSQRNLELFERQTQWE